MDTGNDFLNTFFKQYPQAQSGNMDVKELNKLLSEFQHTTNNRPIDDFDGLSPAQMNALLYEPLSDNCILQLNKSIEQYVEQVPIFKLSELLLAEIQRPGGVKLTVKGNLPVRVCELLLNEQLIKWKYMKYLRSIGEEKIPYIRPLKQYLLDEGIVKKRNNILALTKNGQKFMTESKTLRFTRLLLFFGNSFHWGNFYNIPDNGKYGQLGWAYSLLLLQKYGDKPRDSEFYSSKLINAFEKESWCDYRKETQQEMTDEYLWAYSHRFFECFANWFGLVNIERKQILHVPFIDRLIITKASLLDRIVSKNVNKF